MINISFFSYKGGAGRTSLLYNVLPYLVEELNATPREPIVVIDLDIDSKGLSYLLEADSEYNTIQVLRGEESIGFYTNENDIGKHPFFKNLAPIGSKIGLPGDQNKAVLFISANSTSEDNKYLNNGTNFDSSNISLKSLNRLCQDMNCKAIVMDTPAGEQLTSRVALSISKKVVTVMRITSQFRTGTYNFLNDVAHRYSGKEFIITPNAVPSFEGTIYDINERMSEIANRTSESISKSNNTINHI